MKILLADWAAKHYAPPPSLWVLRKWIREGEIFPPPEKVGCAYYVDEKAQRLNHGHRPTVVERMKAMA